MSSYIQENHMNSNIITVNYPKCVLFETMIEKTTKWLKQEMNMNTVTHVYAHSAGCAIALALTKYFEFPNMILVSPYVAWTENQPKKSKKIKDILLVSTINDIKQRYVVDIRQYIRLSKSNIQVIIGSEEVLLEDNLAFCEENHITKITILEGYIHSLPMWLLKSNVNRLFKNIK